MNLGKADNGETIDLRFAEKIVEENQHSVTDRRGKTKKIVFDGITTSKLRNLLDMVNNVYTKVMNNKNKDLSEEIINDLEYMRVKFAYESGRDESEEKFIEKTYVRDVLLKVIEQRDREILLEYCRYFEALIAYAKFYGMGSN